MKKIIMGFAAILVLGIGTVNAQVSGGIKAEANMSSFATKKNDLSSKVNAGFGVGGFLTVNFSDNFGIQPELLFNFHNSKLKDKSVKNANYGKLRGMDIEIPVYLFGRINGANNSFKIGVGPYVGLGLSSKLKNNGKNVNLYKKKEAGTAYMNRFDFGLGAMASYEFGCGMSINASYKLGMINRFDKSKEAGKIFPRTLALGMGYRF